MYLLLLLQSLRIIGLPLDSFRSEANILVPLSINFAKANCSRKDKKWCRIHKRGQKCSHTHWTWALSNKQSTIPHKAYAMKPHCPDSQCWYCAYAFIRFVYNNNQLLVGLCFCFSVMHSLLLPHLKSLLVCYCHVLCCIGLVWLGLVYVDCFIPSFFCSSSVSFHLFIYE